MSASARSGSRRTLGEEKCDDKMLPMADSNHYALRSWVF
jgi:hypothetical protein